MSSRVRSARGDSGEAVAAGRPRRTAAAEGPAIAVPGRTALVIAHPGHELLIHGWLAAARPVAMVLTDGSGGGGAPRIATTRALLDRVGATPGPVFGGHSDRQVYAALLARDVGFFRAIVERIVGSLSSGSIDAIVSDAIEHFNPIHDIAHAVADAAAVALAGASGRPVARYTFAIERAEEVEGAGESALAVVVRLDPAALAAKQAAADGYRELAAEVATHRNGHDLERLHRVTTPYCWPPQLEEPPFYEAFGARRIREGRYDRLIVYRDHVRPTALALLGARAPHEP